MKQIKSIVEETKMELQALPTNELSIIQKAFRSQEILNGSLQKLKNAVLTKDFPDTESEIQFFKEIKPPLMAELIYYRFISEVEAQKSTMNEADLRRFVDNEFKKIRKVVKENNYFNKYISTEQITKDKEYFTRDKDGLTTFGCNFSLWHDTDFTTNKDMVLANILAAERIFIYISNDSKHVAQTDIFFTGSKYEFTEMIYGLHSTKVFNKGEATIIDVSRVFEQMLNFKMGDIYKTFNEVRSRKRNKTKFTEKTLNCLKLKMKGLDN